MEKVYSVDNMKKGLNIILIFFPFESFTPYKFVSDMIEILYPICNNITIIGGNCNRLNVKHSINIIDLNVKMHYVNINRHKTLSAFHWIIKAIEFQVKSSLTLFSIKDKNAIILFYIAYPHFILPLLTSKYLGKKTIEVVTRSKKNKGVMKILSLQDVFLFYLLDYISPESESLIADLDLEKYRNKITDFGSRYVDTAKYNSFNDISIRKSVIGYVGRLNRDKGVLNFVDAIPLIHEKRPDSEFLIVGTGDLLEEVKIKCNHIQKEKQILITITGFIPENDLPDYYNKMKVLILPTNHAEGLPTVILEAMATGTPILACDRGAITDLIEDGITGFVLIDTKPNHIAEKVEIILERENLEKITYNAQKLIKDRYSLSAAVNRYKNIISYVQKDQSKKI